MHNRLRKEVETSGKVETNRRTADRHKLVLRLGLLEQEGRSVFCLVKNISSAGVQVKPYGLISQGTQVSLRIGDEDPIAGKAIWSRDGLAGIKFKQTLNPQALLRIGQKMVSQKRRAAPRVTTDLKGCLKTSGLKHSVIICDLSMVGARIRASQPITFGKTTIIDVPGLPSLTAYVRWSHEAEYGLSFQTPLPMQIIADLLSGDQSRQIS